MKKNNYWKGFVSGLLMTVLLLAMCLSVSAAANRTIQVEDGIKITLNGSDMTPRDVTGKVVPVFLYEGTTYVPARAISEALGLNVSFNSATRTVVLSNKSSTGTTNQGTGTTSQGTTSSSYITADRAKQIALADAGLSSSNVVFIRAQQDWDDGRAVYEVEFYSGNIEYDYEIDAITGAIRSADRDVEGFTVPNTSSSSSTATITADRAKQIALAEVPGGTVFKCQLDRDDGRLIYEVEVYSGTTEYDFEIDANTGAIISRDVDYRGW